MPSVPSIRQNKLYRTLTVSAGSTFEIKAQGIRSKSIIITKDIQSTVNTESRFRLTGTKETK